MEKESNKLGIISEIYDRFTEKNKEKLVKTALHLLEVQKEDAEMIADVSSSQNDGKKS
ncbi:MAG: hypothetical protein LBK66_12650 [Spirochaetaceae bacterium]|jgi:hypothetical protein|nr:hypothetical protein [Spirochaetaceae bacterium]